MVRTLHVYNDSQKARFSMFSICLCHLANAGHYRLCLTFKASFGIRFKMTKLPAPYLLKTPYLRVSTVYLYRAVALAGTALLLSACVMAPSTTTPTVVAPPEAPVRITTPVIATITPPATNDLPYTVEKITLPGPVVAYVAKINIADPRTKIEVALNDDHDPDGAGPAVGQLTTVSTAAAKHNFHIAMNASFFAAPQARPYLDKAIRYYVGNGAHPVGWHVGGGGVGGKIITTPQNDKLRATIMVYQSRKIRLANNVTEMPADIAYAVSGNAMLLQASNILPKITDLTRAPRSAVGISADGATLLLVAVDGRQTDYSVGASLYELAQIMLDLQAYDAINLDGGGSTAMVLKDEATGVFSLLNQPSDGSANKFPQRVERPVVDVIGVRISGR